MHSVYSTVGSCLETIQSRRPQVLSCRIRPSLLLKTLAVLTCSLTLLIVHVHYSDYVQRQEKALNLAQYSNLGSKSISCEPPSINKLQYVDYNETTLTEKALSMMNNETWLFVKPAMTSDERLTVHYLLKEFVKICDLFNITDYFLFSGSLLGSYRHHGLQPWDDDIDILMRYTDQARILDAFTKYANQANEISVLFFIKRIKLFYRNRSMSIPPYQHRWPFLDMAFYHENETHIWEVSRNEPSNKRHHVLEKSLIFPLHLRPFEAVMISSPRDAYAVLKLLYRDSGCVPLTWLHKTERRPPRKTSHFDCHKVAPIYPFVHRKLVDECIAESLWVNDTLLYTVLIEEPTYALTEPYTLKLITSDSSNTSVT